MLESFRVKKALSALPDAGERYFVVIDEISHDAVVALLALWTGKSVAQVTELEWQEANKKVETIDGKPAVRLKKSADQNKAEELADKLKIAFDDSEIRLGIELTLTRGRLSDQN